MFTPPSFLLAAMSSIFLFIFLHNADVSILHLTCVYIIHIRKGVGLAIPGCTLILCCDRWYATIQPRLEWTIDELCSKQDLAGLGQCLICTLLLHFFLPPFFFILLSHGMWWNCDWRNVTLVGQRRTRWTAAAWFRVTMTGNFACPVRRMRCLWNDYVLARYINIYSHGYEDKIQDSHGLLPCMMRSCDVSWCV